jgi:hypothetical protein
MRKPTFPSLLVQRDHFIDSFLGSVAFALALLDLVRVAAALSDEVIEVEHGWRIRGGIEDWRE